ncbi:MAG: hypothetical protein KF847_17015 [Pirellulales bacterium]|nr:hypothetical protein [Pirellulales bacterium]
MTLPDFTPDGVLPVGDYPLTIPQLRVSMLVTGRPGVTSPTWNATWREELVVNAAQLVDELFQVGITKIFLDGSFVENKDAPGDVDGYFECPFQFRMSGDLENRLNAMNPRSAWTWSRASRRDVAGKSRLPMWRHYRVELYPHHPDDPRRGGTGIKDRFGNDLEFPAAFRQSRSFVPKGIVKILP